MFAAVLLQVRFYSLAQRAQWETVYAQQEKHYHLAIEINADSLATSSVSEPKSASDDTPLGTNVELSPLKDTFDWLTSEEARAEFNATFAPYVLQYPGTVIVYDGHPVEPQKTIDRSHQFVTQPIICPGRVVKDLSLKVIEWNARIGNRKIYFGGESGVVLGLLPANVTAPGFDFSAYAYSPCRLLTLIFLISTT